MEPLSDYSTEADTVLDRISEDKIKGQLISTKVLDTSGGCQLSSYVYFRLGTSYELLEVCQTIEQLSNTCLGWL